jgi:hypothetical protein
MDTANTQLLLVLAGVVIIALITFAAWVFFRKKQTHRLQQRFGPEYGRTVQKLGNRAKAESDLKAREKRVERFHIVPLTPPDASRFREAWKILQGKFVDNPKGAVVEADKLVRDLMLKRGYPMEDFEHRAADLSVDHPAVVEHYRAAQAIAVRGEPNTEELRQAVVHYRALFNELLEVREGKQEAVRPAQMEAKA